jgi:hypothetical protein
LPTVEFENRLVFDRYFYEEIEKEKTIAEVLYKLMYISDKSKGYSRHHNIISSEVFDSISKENPDMPRNLLRMYFSPNEKEDLEKIRDEVERTIKIAIELLKDSPHSVLIFTSKEKQIAYEKSTHLAGIGGINIKSGAAALERLDSYFDRCTRD